MVRSGHASGHERPTLTGSGLTFGTDGQTPSMSLAPPTPGRLPTPWALLQGTGPRPAPAAAAGGGLHHRDDSRPANKNEVHGTPDGPPIRLASGLVLQPMQLNGQRVTRGELMDAIRGASLLPQADVAAVAQAGVKINLLPTNTLEDGLLGATTILRSNDSAPWRPTLVRVAVRARLRGDEATPEIVQHELGHVLSVLRKQDTSEEAAEQYAAAH